ncbi:MAG TPA: hypothetical protein VNW90_08415 [Acetobacteraceae bacterium]|jgi:hypothetical protein|nr:hypothetical protein [Acetobacteraceae bacterium]
MTVKASTPALEQAKIAIKRIQWNQEPVSQTMIRIFLIVVATGLVLLGIAVVFLGAFPPNPAPQPVEKVLPNDKFQTH